MDIRKLNRRLGLISLAAACACLLPLAAEADQARTVKVHYADLNLTTVHGAKTLYARIRGAARSVCGDEPYGIDEQRAWHSCFDGTVSDAVATVNSPMLTAIERGEAPQETAQLRP